MPRILCPQRIATLGELPSYEERFSPRVTRTMQFGTVWTTLYGEPRRSMMRLSVRLKHGDPDETERMFDEAMEQKLTAIEQMKAYLSRRG